MQSRSLFRLRVRRVDRLCLFDLIDSTGQELTATLKYHDHLTDLYQNWQQIYRRRYELGSRARVTRTGGSGTPAAYDWDRELKLAESALLQGFDRWLGDAELLEIRAKLQQPLTQVFTDAQQNDRLPGVDIRLECMPLDLARLPWETWKLAPNETPPGTIRIARTVTMGVAPLVQPASRRSRPRVLALLGNAPDLQPDRDRQALRSLEDSADIECLQCSVDSQAGGSSSIADLKQRIAGAIADRRGWDILFFAGHSDESANTGGKLELAPGISLSIWELEPQLTVAIQRGLQLAIFNSCSGMSIAESLIRLGLSQVVVMREQIQDGVAHAFLQQFCQRLTCYQDVHTALQSVCQYFLAEQISYPSAYLVPSLFRHPDPRAGLFQLEPSAIKRLWQQWRLTRWQAIALSTLALLSLMTPVREALTDGRYWTEAVYRHMTRQLPAPTTPPVMIVSIDQASIERRGIDIYKVKPIDRLYLAALMERLQQLNINAIGIDYLLDGTTQEDAHLAKAIQSAIQKHTWVVFATKQNDTGQPIRVNLAIAQGQQTLQGTIEFLDWNLALPSRSDCSRGCPFAYQLAVAHRLQQFPQAPKPQIQHAIPLQQQVNQFWQRVDQPRKNSATRAASLQQPPPLNLTPIIDFSLPPAQVYQQLPAWELLERPLHDSTLQAMQHQVVIVAAGGYDQADDNFRAPLATTFWRSRLTASASSSQILTGGEVHAYMVYHWLSQHRVFRIPDLWMLGLAILVGKGLQVWLIARSPQSQRQWRWFLAATAIYGWLTLQIYISAAALVPWLLPSLAVWICLFSEMRLRSQLPNARKSLND